MLDKSEAHREVVAAGGTASERGETVIKALGLGGASVTGIVMPGVAYVDHDARCDPIIQGELDRGGAIFLITPYGITSKNCGGMVTSGFRAAL